MTTEQIAARLVELSRLGQYETAQRELFANDAVSIEPEKSPGAKLVEGLEAIVAKGKHFQSMIEAIHASNVSDAVVAGNFFSVSATLDVTLKGPGRINMEEVIVYAVKEGKIASEQFFY